MSGLVFEDIADDLKDVGSTYSTRRSNTPAGDTEAIIFFIHPEAGQEMQRMKRQVLFVQGGGENVHADWDAKLVESLRSELGPNYDIHYPRMPDQEDPKYVAWKATLEKELAALDDGAILVGHSIGGTILINALAKHSPERELGAIILVAAPFVGEGGWDSHDWKPQRELVEKLPSGVPIFLFHGLADDTAPPTHAGRGCSVQ